MRIDDVRRLDLGTFVRPAEETGTGEPRVEAVYAYAVRTPAGVLLLDTGLGEADEETEAWYRPRRVSLSGALATAGLTNADIALVANCHLHFDHIGWSPSAHCFTRLTAFEPIELHRDLFNQNVHANSGCEIKLYRSPYSEKSVRFDIDPKSSGATHLTLAQDGAGPSG